MISSKINEDSLLEAIIFSEAVKRMKLNGEDGTWDYGYFFIKRVARLFQFKHHPELTEMLSEDL